MCADGLGIWRLRAVDVVCLGVMKATKYVRNHVILFYLSCRYLVKPEEHNLSASLNFRCPSRGP